MTAVLLGVFYAAVALAVGCGVGWALSRASERYPAPDEDGVNAWWQAELERARTEDRPVTAHWHCCTTCPVPSGRGCRFCPHRADGYCPTRGDQRDGAYPAPGDTLTPDLEDPR